MAADKFWDKVTYPPNAVDDCWPWGGGQKAGSYGQTSVNGRCRGAHVVMYERAIGPIPEGLEIDHICRNRSCVNPLHLEAVTHSVNQTRIRERKGTCRNGHSLTPDNLFTNSRGYRLCLTCSRDTDKRFRERRAKVVTCHEYSDTK